MRGILFIIFFIVTVNSFAREPIATVVIVKGSVTKLRPGAMQASLLVQGEKLEEDTSVVTGPSSFTQIRLIDDSILSLGPESKLVLAKIRPTEVSVIALLKGSIRTKVRDRVSKHPNREVIVSTRTAALGVRGTEFQTVYNPTNRATALLTYKGKVAMAKLPERSESQAPDENPARLQANLAKSDILVESGQYSGVSAALSKPTLPIVIAPTQIQALYKNEELSETQTASTSSDVVKITPQNAPIEGVMDLSTGRVAPKAGGFLDLATAQYIAPEKDAAFNQETNTFIAKNVGSIDSNTGLYQPPAGMILDPVKGFQVDTTVASSDSNLLLRSKELNSTTLLPQKEFKELSVSKPRFAQLNYRELAINQHVQLSLALGSEEIVTTLPTTGEVTHKSNSYHRRSLLWEQATGGNYQIVTEVSQTKSTLSGYSASGDTSTMSLTAGLKKILSPSYSAGLLGGIEQQNFYDGTQIFQMSLLRVKAMVDGTFWRYRRLSFSSNLLVHFSPAKDKADYSFKPSYGYRIQGTLAYWFKQRAVLELGIYQRSDFVTFDALNQSAIKAKRAEGGPLMQYSFYF